MKAALAVVFCGSIFAQQASIEGVTVDTVTKAPVAGVHVRLVTGSSSNMTGAYGAISDREGRFSIATIRPGTYIVFPERSGYLYAVSRADAAIPNIMVHPGEHLTGVRIEMAPRAMVSGRVVDEFGDPVQGVNVQTVAVSEKEGLAILMNPPSIPTDDRGEFRIATVQGRYYVQASAAGNTNSNERPEVRTDGTSATPYNATFYPSSIVKERGTPVEAIGGKEIPGIEIRLSRQWGLSISGRVSGIPDGGRPSVVAQWGKSAGQVSNSNNIGTDLDGRFTLPATPGFYRIWGAYYGKPRLASRMVELQVDSTDVSNLELALGPGTEVNGTVEFEGDPPGAPAEPLAAGQPAAEVKWKLGRPVPRESAAEEVSREKRTVRLEETSSRGYNPLQPTGGETDDKGAFRVEGVGAGKFRVRVEPMPENAYVKRVELDGSAGDGAIVDLKSGARSARLKVTINRNGRQLTGRVVDENGQRLLTALVMVMLAPVPTPEQMSNDMAAEVQPDGRYSFKGLRPGKYRVVAVDMLRVALNSGQDAQLKLLEKGEDIEIKEGDRIEKEIRLLPKEDADAKSAVKPKQ